MKLSLKEYKNVFLDTEFNPETNELISLAVVDEDGRELYFVLNDWDESKATPFLKEVVIPLLPCKSEWISRDEARKKIVDFFHAKNNWRFWAWYASNDWHYFLGFWPDWTQMPRSIPFFIWDYRVELERDKDWSFTPGAFLGGKPAHSALFDAQALKDAFIARKGYLLAMGESVPY